MLRPADDSARLGRDVAVPTRGVDPLALRAVPFVPRWPFTAGADRGGRGSYDPGGAVEEINSAKSPIDSRSTLASRGWGAFGRNLAPVFAAGAGAAFGTLLDLTDFGASVGGFECSPVYLLTDEECDLLVGGLGPSWGFRMTGGAAKRGDSGEPWRQLAWSHLPVRRNVPRCYAYFGG